jgi:hypothetical protein
VIERAIDLDAKDASTKGDGLRLSLRGCGVWDEEKRRHSPEMAWFGRGGRERGKEAGKKKRQEVEEVCGPEERERMRRQGSRTKLGRT